MSLFPRVGHSLLFRCGNGSEADLSLCDAKLIQLCRSPAVRTDLFQHRLWLPEPAAESDPHSWTDVLIPFSDFALTNSGELSAHQIEMMRQKVRSVGISVLGPKEGR